MKSRSIPALCLIIVFTFCCFTGCAKEVIVKPIQSASADKSPDNGAASYPVELGPDALAEFEAAFNMESNYGFLLSSYSDVRDVDLYQVFYIGAGIEPPANADEIRAAYERTLTDGPYDIDSTILTAQQVSGFLLAKTGYSLDDMNSRLGWDYVDGYDAYIHYHGDTNFISISCTGGRMIGDALFQIDYEFDGGIYDEEGNHFTGGSVTVSIPDETIQYVSNSLH